MVANAACQRSILLGNGWAPVGGLIGPLLLTFRALFRGAAWIRGALDCARRHGDLMRRCLVLWLLAQVNPGDSLFGVTFHPGQAAAFEPAMVELTQAARADRHRSVTDLHDA